MFSCKNLSERKSVNKHYTENYTSKLGFTLAEVLITLGIIGVVAALTLPALMTNYQKVHYLNRLKQTYAQLMVGIEAVAAEQDMLPMHQWKCTQSWDEGKFNYIQESCFHLVPEQIGAKMHGRSPDNMDQVMCYEGTPYRPYTQMNGDRGNIGTSGKWLHTYSWSATLPNGACVVWMAYAWTGDARGSMVIDVDGPYAGPNRFGKDTFRFLYTEANSGAGRGPNGLNIYPVSYSTTDRNRVKNDCRNSGSSCGGLIWQDGWQMKPDYPW